MGDALLDRYNMMNLQKKEWEIFSGNGLGKSEQPILCPGGQDKSDMKGRYHRSEKMLSICMLSNRYILPE